MDNQLPLLWHFPISHFNEKARWALDWKGIPHRRVALFADYLFRVPWATGRMTLPVLHLEGRAIGDSTDIITALEARQPDPPLLPADPQERARALEIEDWFDEEVGPPVRTLIVGEAFESDPQRAFDVLSSGVQHPTVALGRRLLPLFTWFYRKRAGIDPRSRAKAEAQVEAGFDRIESERVGRAYLVGDAFSMADLTAAALLSPIVQPSELETRIPLDAFPQKARDFRDRMAAHPGFAWVEGIFRKHRGHSSACDP